MFKVGFLYPGYENLGVEYLSANLKRQGFDTRLFFDPVLFSESGFIDNRVLGNLFSFRERVLKNILFYQPDLFCFSVITDNYKWACEWAREIKKHVSIPIVFGGMHPTSVPEKVILEPFIDYACIGEGDDAIVELAQAINEGKPANQIPNIWSKNHGFIHKNPVRPLITDLDTLPFPDKNIYYSQFPIFKEGYLISASRGCPFKCSYCCNNVYHFLYNSIGKTIRRRSISNVLEELKEAKEKYRIKFIHFVDEVLNYDRKWLFEFLAEYKKRINLPFSCYVYPDFVDRFTARELKAAGCFKVQMGVQVISDEKKKNILKRISSQKNISEAISFLKKEKIYVTCDNIFGFPDDKEEELISLCHFYNEHTPDNCENFWLRYYPRTEITAWAFKNNYLSAGKIGRIERGEFSFGLLKNPEYLDSKSNAGKFITLLSLYPFLTKRLRKFILNKRFYRFLPSLSPIVLLLMFRLFNRAKYDFNTIRTIKRYMYFCIKRFKRSTTAY